MPLSHINKAGEAHMVDVSEKAQTQREATASVSVQMSQDAFQTMIEGNNKKGDVIGTARIAGIMAAKKTSDLIPLCHPLLIKKVTIDFDLDADKNIVVISSYVKVTGQTGVEMEALTAASVTALTLYDMLKAIDKSIEINGLRLTSKTGGKSGDYQTKSEG